MQSTLFKEKSTIKVRALFIGERIDIRALETTHRLAISPLMVTVGEGCAVLLRYGVVVLFNLDPLEEISFLAHVKPMVRGYFSQPEVEEGEISIDPNRDEQMDNGVILLHEPSIECLQIIADILAKSVVLARYEASVTEVFDRVEPLAAGLQQKWKRHRKGRELVRYIGDTLLVYHKMVGRVEVGEKPELLWDHPELERLYARLEDEYELRERHTALERKLELIFRTVETLLDLLQNNRSLRVEWYIIILIVVEILLMLYEIFFRG